MNYDNNKKFGLLKFYSGYGKFNLNSPKGFSLKIFNAQTEHAAFITGTHYPSRLALLTCNPWFSWVRGLCENIFQHLLTCCSILVL